MHDTVESAMSVLKEATETKNYMIAGYGYDYDTGVIDINEASVKNKKDWNSADKIDYREITVETPPPVPAPGPVVVPDAAYHGGLKKRALYNKYKV